jgi:hypothetical protein
MRKLFTFLAAVLLTANLFLPRQASAQTPEKMSYQAVIRDSSNALVTNTQVGMEINIRQGSISGTIVYTETQTPTTNANGLVSIEIGGGPGFNAINWSSGPYFIETKTDIAGGTNYTISGTSQLLSVPYALHTKIAETVIVGGLSNDYYLGQDTLGGIVFYLCLDQNGEQHGLIVSKTDTITLWQNYACTTGATYSWNGAYNMIFMFDSPAKNWITTHFSNE